MRKCYLFFFVLFFISKISFAQCPAIVDAMANACGTTEGSNEFVIFTTSVADTVGSYTLYYGSHDTPTVSATGILPGSNASPASGTGSVSNTTGCTIIEVTSPTTVIPANSTVIFIPADFDEAYDLSEICTRAGGTLYVTYINTTAGTGIVKWSDNGTLVNSPSSPNIYRYLEMQYDKDPTCSTNVRRYTNGWASNKDGNFLTWVSDTDVVYSNSGCTTIVTPIKLLSFTGQLSGTNISLSWQTANEFNTKSFEVEWSSDGINFTSIGTEAAAGNSSITKKYSKIDFNVASGTNFYRLKITDNDGRVSYSQVIRINNSKNGAGILVSPDLSGSQLNVQWTSRHTGNTTAVLFDYVGRILAQKQISTIVGTNRSFLNIATLPKGSYVVKLLSNGESIVTRFVKQ